MMLTTKFKPRRVRNFPSQRINITRPNSSTISKASHYHRAATTTSKIISSTFLNSKPTDHDLVTTTTTTSLRKVSSLTASVTSMQGLQSTLITSRSKSSIPAAAAAATFDQSVQDFPSIVIGSNGSILPQGSFAEAQAQFLTPDEDSVKSLAENLTKANMGIVAHYYMDVELQGVLTAVQKEQMKGSNDKSKIPRIAIADSLAMGDWAVKMCQDGATSIVCLGVDFMSESVSTIMRRNGFGHVPVYRATSKKIGCSLAESAERDSYRAWLEKGRTENDSALHVVYINTSLETKAVSTSIIPTITCTSSNVLSTILQASVEIPNIKILYGPDTYMGENLITMLTTILDAGWDNERIQKELHPSHTLESIRRLRDNIDVFPNGNCVVHHMFGNEVVNTVKTKYDDAYVTAHLEVPGEMFKIAMEKSLTGNGVVGSTSNILNFISSKVQQIALEEKAKAIPSNAPRRLKFILGTEAGMVTSIVKSVQDILAEANCNNVETEIVFPVSSEAVMSVDDEDLAIVPGVAGGEGCSTAGGCATCPFMKMNDLDALNDIVDLVIKNEHELKLKSHLPPNRLHGKRINGEDAVDLGSESILFMRHFMKEKSLPDQLVKKVTNTQSR